MNSKIRITQMFATVFIIFVAAIQWLVILERVWALIWEWHKFYGYDNDGGITVGVGTQVLFYLLSSGFALAGLILSSKSSDDPSFQKKLNRFSVVALLLGMILWTLILISPFVTFR